MNIRRHFLQIPISNKLLRRAFIGVSILLFTACAQIVTPTGGPRDIKPPKLLKSTPPNNSTLFATGTQIKLTFDEYIDLSNANEKVMISPPLKSAPTFKVSGKSILIDFADTLRPNTTYSLFFDNCIKDITENNILPLFEYNFSTGTFLDSGAIKGTVIDAYTLKPEKQVYVMLYPQDIDSLPSTQKPNYITKTNDVGSFSFAHVQNGKYKLFALNDKNNNLLFDQFSERIGYSQSMIETGKSDEIEVKMFSQIDTAQRILKTTREDRGKLMIAFRKEATAAQFKLMDGNFEDRFIKEFSQSTDTVFLYDRYFLPDTITLFISDQQALDTFVVSPSTERKASRRISNPTLLSLSINEAKELYHPLVVHFNSPIKKIDNERITFFKLGKDTVPVLFSITHLDSIGKKISINFKKEEQQTYLLMINDSAFTGYNTLNNDSVRTQFTVLTENDYGNLLIHVDNQKNKTLIIQLVNEQLEVINEQKTNQSNSISWKNLLPGTYQVRAVIDENGNGKWDNGDYFLKRQPEKIVIFATSIQIRAKWDIEEKFVIN